MRVLLLVPVLAATTLGCGAPDEARVPGPAVVDFDIVVADTVVIDDGGLEEAEIRLTPGQAVLFRYEGSSEVRLTATKDGDETLDTGSLHPGEETTVVFADAGTYLVTDGVSMLSVKASPAAG